MIDYSTDFFKNINSFDKFKEVKSKLIIGDITNEPPLISIVIPTFKRANLLKESIDSAINQKNYDNYEIIVVDNEAVFDTETETEKLMKSYKNSKIYYYKNEENIGMFGNWNRCIELARGTWLTILNDDDFLDETFLFEMFKILNKKRKILSLYCDYKIVYDIKTNGKKYKSTTREFLRGLGKIREVVELKLSSFYMTHRSWGSLGIIFSRQEALNIGGFNEKFYPISDYVFFAKYTYDNGGSYKLKKDLCNMRFVSNTSLNVNVIQNSEMFSYLFRSYILSKTKIPKILDKLYSEQRRNLNIINSINLFNLDINLFPEIKDNKKANFFYLVYLFRIIDLIKYGR